MKVCLQLHFGSSLKIGHRVTLYNPSFPVQVRERIGNVMGNHVNMSKYNKNLTYALSLYQKHFVIESLFLQHWHILAERTRETTACWTADWELNK